MDLHLNPEDLHQCVQCGLCLPHCPTYRVTGDEAMSPRGRIALMRAVNDDGAPLTKEVVRSFETCVQRRGCETACPSGVKYGSLIESTREALAEQGEITHWIERLGLGILDKPKTVRAGSRALAVAQRVHLVPKRLGLPRVPLRDTPLESEKNAGGESVWFFTGCVMDAWQRDVHRDAIFVLEAAGCSVRITGDAAPCCGALHTHAGLRKKSERMATLVIAALAGSDPIVVDSAGCGAAMKEYGQLLGTEAARAFSARVVDISEFLAERMDRFAAVAPLNIRVAVQDPCHLRHVQKIHLATRTVLAPFVSDLVELDDEGLCCGAGGAYSAHEPELAGLIRDRKVASINRVDPDVVASANPGCSMHLQAVGVPAQHPMTLLAKVLRRS